MVQEVPIGRMKSMMESIHFMFDLKIFLDHQHINSMRLLLLFPEKVELEIYSTMRKVNTPYIKEHIEFML